MGVVIRMVLLVVMMMILAVLVVMFRVGDNDPTDTSQHIRTSLEP